MKRTCTAQFFRFAFLTTMVLAHSVKTLAQERPLIFPVPQQLQVTHDAFVMDETVSIIIPQNIIQIPISLRKNFKGKEGA